MPRRLAKRDEEPRGTQFIVFACLIPVLVCLSGLFAGLTLGYMSLDETQLNVLSISGTPEQKRHANRIKPIRKNGHLLLVTLLLANMIVNETLPLISEPVLGGGIQSVVVSTVLIVIFAEVIPQSVCTRYGLAVGSKMAPFVKFMLYTLGVIAWPVAKLLEFTLGAHHGIIYRRSELKELIHIHSDSEAHGGDLKHDTVTIIGATLDLQEKVVKHAMTPIQDVFMLSIDAVLDWETLRKICLTGHSRVPVYEEVDVPFGYDKDDRQNMRMERVKKIVGILLVKQCVLLDPSDAVPVRKIPLNKVPFVPQNEPLLGILDRFQEGRSHMAIVTRFSEEKAASVKKVVKKGLTQRIRNRVGMGDSSDSSSEDEDDAAPSRKKDKSKAKKKSPSPSPDGVGTLRGDASEKDDAQTVSSVTEDNLVDPSMRGRSVRADKHGDIELGIVQPDQPKSRSSFQLPRVGGLGLEQSMPADAVLAKKGAEEFLQSFDPGVAPLGIITLEDVLEELIGEEIYDEFDPEVAQYFASFVPPPSPVEAKSAAKPILKRRGSAPNLNPKKPSSPSAAITEPAQPAVTTPVVTPDLHTSKSATSTPVLRPMALPAMPTLPGLRNLSLFSGLRSSSAPPTRRNSRKGAETPGDRSGSKSAVATSAFFGRSTTPAQPEDTRISEEAADRRISPVDDAMPTSLLHGGGIIQATTSTPVLTLVTDVEGRNGHHVGVTFAEPSVDEPKHGTGGVAHTHIAAIPGSVANALSAPQSARSASPAPSLEAFLLNSKRRHQQRDAAAAAHPSDGAAGASKDRVPATLYKGTRFKSSPITGERGGVVAEQVQGAWRPADGEKVSGTMDGENDA